jgi:MFS family permease
VDAAGRAPGLRPRRPLITLCVTEVTSWGVLYYAFPVLAPTISADTGWSVAAVTAGFSVGLVVAAVAGIPVGRLLDRYGPRPVMTAGTLLAIPSTLAVAGSRTLAEFLLSWVFAGIAMSAVLYQPAFAALTRWYGPRRVTALTILTLAAGLASTVYAPITAALVEHLSWRQTYAVLAVLLAAITLPGHVFGLKLPWTPAESRPEHQPDAVARSGAFIALTAALSLAAFAAYAAVVNLVPLLTHRGMSTSQAALALGLGGIGQVLGRLGYGRLTATTTVRTRTTVVLLAAAGTILLLGLLPGPYAALVVLAVLAGSARGIFTLVQATAVTDRWGPTHYGRLNGLLSAPGTFAAALAPWAGAALAGQLGGYPAVFCLLAGVGTLGAGLATLSRPPYAAVSTVAPAPTTWPRCRRRTRRRGARAQTPAGT